MSIGKTLGRVGIVLSVAALVVCGGGGKTDGGSGGGKATLVGRWDLMEGSARGNPEAMELLKDGTGIVDGGGITYKTEGGRFYIMGDGAASYDYKVTGSTFTLTKDNGAVLKYVKKGTAIKSGSFTDSRNGQKYRTVNIGDKTWMGENLNFKTGNSWCYNDDESNCAKYGRLYDWETAKTACPSGWHLPSREEWNKLVETAGGDDAGRRLKSASDWNGTDVLGFSALPGGCRNHDGSFNDAGRNGNWWSASEGGSGAYFRDMYSGNDDVGETTGYKSLGFSVRCAQD